jgi:hypothetical protein
VCHALTIAEPKADRSRRTVPMPPAVASMLRKHRTEQKAERLRAGNQWQAQWPGVHDRAGRSGSILATFCG